MKKKDFVKLHRELWNRIVVFFDNGGGELEDGIHTLKQQIINDMRKEHLLNCLTRKEIDESMTYGCFACAYTTKSDSSVLDCALCPLDWGLDYSTHFMCEIGPSPYEEIFENLAYSNSHDWEHLAELARQVRDLPLKEGVLDV